MCVPSSAAFTYFSKLVFSGGPYHDQIWAVRRAEMAVATFFAFGVTARDEVPDMVNTDDDHRLVTQPSGVLVSLSVEFCNAIGEVVVFSFFFKVWLWCGFLETSRLCAAGRHFGRTRTVPIGSFVCELVRRWVMYQLLNGLATRGQWAENVTSWINTPRWEFLLLRG